MNFKSVKALTFNTRGTILDWHTGFRDALKTAGDRHNIKRDWADIANRLSRRSLGKMVNLGEEAPPAYHKIFAHHLPY